MLAVVWGGAYIASAQLAHFLLLIHSRIPSHGMVPPKFRVSVALFVKIFWKHPHTQRYGSIVILNLINLTMKTIILSILVSFLLL